MPINRLNRPEHRQHELDQCRLAAKSVCQDGHCSIERFFDTESASDLEAEVLSFDPSKVEHLRPVDALFECSDGRLIAVEHSAPFFPPEEVQIQRLGGVFKKEIRDRIEKYIPEGVTAQLFIDIEKSASLGKTLERSQDGIAEWILGILEHAPQDSGGLIGRDWTRVGCPLNTKLGFIRSPAGLPVTIDYVHSMEGHSSINSWRATNAIPKVLQKVDKLKEWADSINSETLLVLEFHHITSESSFEVVRPVSEKVANLDWSPSYVHVVKTGFYNTDYHHDHEVPHVRAGHRHFARRFPKSPIDPDIIEFEEYLF